MIEENSFGSVATQAPPAPAPAEEAAGLKSRAFLIAGAVAVAVLAMFAYLLFGTGGGDAESSGTVPLPVAPGASSPTTPATDPAPAPATPAPVTVKGRNPFRALEVQAPEDAAAATDGTTGTGGTAATPTAPTTPVGETVSVTLVKVNGDLVTAKVGSTTYKKVSAGESFGTSFQVYAIFNDKCAGFLYGDSSFALCEGGSTTLAKL